MRRSTAWPLRQDCRSVVDSSSASDRALKMELAPARAAARGCCPFTAVYSATAAEDAPGTGSSYTGARVWYFDRFWSEDGLLARLQESTRSGFARERIAEKWNVPPPGRAQERAREIKAAAPMGADWWGLVGSSRPPQDGVKGL